MMKLLAHVAAGPKKGYQKSADKPVKKINKYGEDKNIHKRQN
jgi:hypothetical protein